jgi:subtilisin family serine protease
LRSAGLTVLLIGTALLSSSGVAAQHDVPQTGGMRLSWPQRPGAPRVIAVQPTPQIVVDADFVANQVMVQFQPGTAEAGRAAVRAAVNGAVERQLRSTDGGLELVSTPLAVAEAVQILQAFADVEFAEPNWIVRHDATSNDPRVIDGSLFGMYGESSSPSNPFGSQAAEAWAKGFTGSNDVFVGVIDEGIYFEHEDLSANVWINPFDPVDGFDNDGNGYVDDVRGWDFMHGDNSIYDSAVDDHGTHVAGTIGARGGNGIGVAGVNWNVKLIGGKFLEGTGDTFDAITAIDYMTDLKIRHGLNIVAVSNSWGGYGYSQGLHQAMIRAAKADILFIASAGNDALDTDVAPHYPSSLATNVTVGNETAASYDAVISVAAITNSGALAGFSNFGATSVDIGAPGQGILSTTPLNGYSVFNGTSMAAPHVAGAVALYKSINPDAPAAQIRSAVLGHGIATASLSGKTTSGDRLNVGDFSASYNMTISDARVAEGHSGTKSLAFTVSLSAASSLPIAVNYATSDVTAHATGTTSNSASVTIPSSGMASPYPATISVPAGWGTITNLRVRLSGFNHTWPNDVDVLLVGPAGQTVVLMSDVGSSTDAVGLTFTFDDAASASLPSSGALVSGTFRPTNIASGSADVFAAPAPGGPYGMTLAGFTGTDPGGQWKLFVVDDTGAEAGSISGGWSLLMATTAGADYVTASGTLTVPAGSTSHTVSVTVSGDLIAEASESLKVTLSDASANIVDAEGIGTIVNDDFTDPSLTGAFIKAVHILELRAAVNEARAAKGLAPFVFSDPTLTAQSTGVKVVHINELRTALAAAYSAAGQPLPVYTDATIAPGVTVIKAIHFADLRAAVASLP